MLPAAQLWRRKRDFSVILRAIFHNSPCARFLFRSVAIDIVNRVHLIDFEREGRINLDSVKTLSET